MSEILFNKKRSFYLTKEDLNQHLSLLWLSYYKQYTSKEKKPEVSLRTYLLRRSIWGIRDWLNYETNIITEDAYYTKNELVETGFKLDLKFLIEGTDFQLLSVLSPYERYLIFLKFKEEKSILQMSFILQKDRRIVKKHFDLIMQKIKENSTNGILN